MSIVAVQIPLGVPPGGQFMAIGPGGVQMMIVNPGLAAGSIIHVRAPPPPPLVAAGAPQPPQMDRAPAAVEEVKKEDIPEDAVIEKAIVPGYEKTTLNEAPKNHELCPFMACCCVAYSCYPVFPDCFGTYFKGVACACIQVEQLCCKVSKSDGTYFKCFAGECEIVQPQGFSKFASTVCCLDARFALPTDGEVPCQMAFLGLVCVKSWKLVCKFYSTADAVEKSAQSPTSAKV